jgi:response regulator RpfG family c-di-GMP phosphodiesterase
MSRHTILAQESDEEWVTMRSHAAIGGELVGRIDAFAHLAPAVRASHERWDGGGYPAGAQLDTTVVDALIGELDELPER